RRRRRGGPRRALGADGALQGRGGEGQGERLPARRRTARPDAARAGHRRVRPGPPGRPAGGAGPRGRQRRRRTAHRLPPGGPQGRHRPRADRPGPAAARREAQEGRAERRGQVTRGFRGTVRGCFVTQTRRASAGRALPRLRVGFVRFLGACLVALAAGPGAAQAPSERVGLDQRLGEQVPLELTFRDEQGRAVRLGEALGGKPAVLVLAYYRCPRLCNLVLNGLLDAVKGIPFDAGDQYQVVVVSIDPRETPELAAAKKASYVEAYGRPGAEAGFRFLTGGQEAIDRLAAAGGYRYLYRTRQDQLAPARRIPAVTPGRK